jgi:hypothetical protein
MIQLIKREIYVLHSGYDKEILYKIKTLVSQVKFPDEKDNKLLMKWFEDLNSAPDLSHDPFHEVRESGMMLPRFPSELGLENIQKYDFAQELLLGIKDALDRNDQKSAQAKLRQLTGKVSWQRVFALILGILAIVGIFGMVFIEMNE